VKVKKWLTAQENAELISDIERSLEKDRDLAESSPMPEPESAAGGVYCEDGCHEIKPKYGMPKIQTGSAPRKPAETEVHLK